MGDFSPHFSTLNLNGLYITFELLELGTEVSVLIPLGNTLVTETRSLEGFLIKHASGTGSFVSKIDTLFGFVGEQELEVLKLLAGFTDFIS